MITRKLSTLCAASGFAVLTACSAGQPPSASAQAASTASSSNSLLGSTIDHALDQASVELNTKNITVSNDDRNLPKAEITPQGDFLIAGKPVALTPQQRTQVLAYRRQMVEIGREGIAIGKQGATLGMHVASEALAAAFSGQSEQQIRQHAEAQASGIRQAAAKICGRLPALMEQQRKLAAALPAFRPYATMTQKDIDDCRKNALNGDDD